ncbi:LysR family transcriptional regulator [Rhizobium sp. P38BS-XIX]|uniref:LysR family transcriptional regulator n=1 Tax=Rhizobium sp. P38BS-XIX TaxID=2726740 RepID=UPI001456C11E|nr:LysR family transcriptional regulator [Rhizobium sp. P38BS-XIX]NLR98031.1 LysR family transcriptional regulator [Rhizobium sp. P38BS-XIX]
MNRLAAMDAFVRVVDTGSFTGAARLLRIGQPAVSKMIAQLEERVGTKLLLRTTQGLTPTEAGENFYEHARRAVEQADEAEAKARGSGAALSGRLRISGAVTFARLHVVPLLPKFLAMHPDLDIEVFMDDQNVDLVEAGIDVALRMGDLQDSSLTARKIGKSPRVVVASPRYIETSGEPASPADLAAHHAVVYDLRSGGTVWNFSRGSVQSAVTIKGRIRMNAAEGVREAVFAGMGLAVASEWMFAPELASGRVRRLLEDWDLPPVDLWAAFPSGRTVSSKARAFASFIKQELASKFSNGSDLTVD